MSKARALQHMLRAYGHSYALLQFEVEARKLWQQALHACTSQTDAKLVLQAHRLLYTPGAINAALPSDSPQLKPASAQATANGLSKVIPVFLINGSHVASTKPLAKIL